MISVKTTCVSTTVRIAQVCGTPFASHLISISPCASVNITQYTRNAAQPNSSSRTMAYFMCVCVCVTIFALYYNIYILSVEWMQREMAVLVRIDRKSTMCNTWRTHVYYLLKRTIEKCMQTFRTDTNTKERRKKNTFQEEANVHVSDECKWVEWWIFPFTSKLWTYHVAICVFVPRNGLFIVYTLGRLSRVYVLFTLMWIYCTYLCVWRTHGNA